MLSGIFQKRKKSQELRSPALQDIKKFRDAYARNAERRHVETPSCLEKSVYKAISCQKELHSVDFRQEDITDPQLIALAETLVEMPMISTLDLRDNRITDDGARALLEVLRLQIIAAKTPLKTDSKTRLPLFPAVPEYTRYVTQVNMKGNEISASVLQELAQYTEILKREDKRVEIRAALAQIDRNSAGGIDEDEFKAVLKLLTGTEPNKKEVKMLMQQHSSQTSSGGGSGAGDSSIQKSAMSLENLLLAKCSSSPSKKAACPPWEALVQVRHAALGQQYPSQLAKAKSECSAAAEFSHGSTESGPAPVSGTMHRAQSQQIPQKTNAPNIQVSNGSSSSVAQRIPVATAASNANVKLAMAMPPPPPLQIPAPGNAPSYQQQQQQSPVSSSSGSSDRGDGSAYANVKTDFKPPASPPPPLPLPQTVASSASSPDSKGAASRSVHSFSSSSGRGSQENALAEQPSYPSKHQVSSATPNPVEAPALAPASRGAPSSPDRMSVYSSSSSFSQFIDSVETPRQVTAPPPVTSVAAPSQPTAAVRVTIEDLEKKKSTPQHSVANSVISDSPRWRDEDIFTDDEADDVASTGHSDDGGADRDDTHGDGLNEDSASKAGGSSSNELHSTGSVSSSSKASHSSGLSKSHTVSQQQHQRIDSGTFASEIVELSDGEDGPAPPLLSTTADKADQLSVSSRTDKDLSSLIYRAGGDEAAESGAVARRQLALGLIDDQRKPVEPQSNNDDPVDDDDDKEERVDSIVSDIVKDGKSRSVAKVVHSEFKRGLLLKDSPNEVPFRNLVALVLSENGLSNLALFKECRLPCVLVLDLSNNRLTKLADEDFGAFPKLQTLNLAHNRLRSIQGLGKVFDLKALNVDHNAIKTVKNIEHLVQLQVLKVSSNFISTISALRLLSLNKMLTHLDLDGNSIVETDERQKRKNIVHILNLMPELLSLGSIPCASLHSKEKKKAMALQGLHGGDKSGTAAAAVGHGRALLDTNDLFPDFSALWITKACEILQCLQDVEVQRKNRASYNNDGDDDHWGGGGGSNDDESDARHPRKPLNKKQQLQKDELRSRAVGYRSREKAMPSPPKVKTSVYSFGPPLPPPSAKPLVKKKAPPADPKVVKQQQRRASELSAPKHQPVDKQLLSEEQKRKSRPTFDVNMSVAERLTLAQEKAQRRSSTATGSKTMSSTGMHRTKSVVMAGSGNTDVNAQTLPVQTPESPTSSSNSTAWSPGRGNQEVVAFRIEPLRSSTSPAKSSSVEKSTYSQQHPVVPGSTKPNSRPSSPNPKPLVFLVAPSPPKLDSKTVPGSNAKESTFLQDLAITNFLSHAEEEFSTAMTALNVLLTMSEKELSDTRKLVEYRGSLEALDILDERESHAMYARIRDYKEHHARGVECTQAFEQLGVVKKSMRQLLEKLETHAPGSSAIRAFCRSLRINDLRDILNTSEAIVDVQEHHEGLNRPEALPVVSVETRKRSSPEKSTAVSPGSMAQSSASANDTWDEDPERDFVSFRESAAETSPVPEPVETPKPEPKLIQPPDDDEDDEFNFLSSDKSVFDNDPSTSDDTFTAAPSLDFLDADEKQSASPSHSPVPVAAYSPKLTTYAVTTDITEDIQSHDDDDVFSGDETAGETEVDAGAELLEPGVDEDKPALATDPSEPTPPDEDLDDAWLTTESSALDELDTETEGAAADSSDDIFGDEEEQIQTEDIHVVPVHVAEAPANDFDDDAIDDFGSREDEEPQPSSTSEYRENQDVDADVTAEGDFESTEVDQSEVENPLSEAEDADDEEAEMFGDWEKGFDPSTNHYFWFNHETGESAWTPPEGWPYEVDTPFEADEEYCAEGEAGGEAQTDVEEATGGAEYDGESAQETQEDQVQWECEGEQSAIESSQRPLSEFDDDLFSDQDLPTF